MYKCKLCKKSTFRCFICDNSNTMLRQIYFCRIPPYTLEQLYYYNQYI